MVANLQTNCANSGFAGHLGDVRAFCEVVTRGSISAAACSLGETKGAVSRRISRLEARLGVHLLARSQRRVMPTEEGTRFHLRATAALIQLDEAADEARGHSVVPRGRLRVSAPIDLACDLLAPLLVEFRQAYPQISVDMRVDNSQVDLAAERIDLALRVSGIAPQPPHVVQSITEMPLGLFASAHWLTEHILAETPLGIGPDDLVIVDWPGISPLSLASASGQTLSLPAGSTLMTSDFAAAKALALAGAGVALLPLLIARKAVMLGDLVPVFPDWQARGASLYAITLAGRDEPARSRLFRQFLGERLSK